MKSGASEWSRERKWIFDGISDVLVERMSNIAYHLFSMRRILKITAVKKLIFGLGYKSQKDKMHFNGGSAEDVSKVWETPF